MATYSLLHFGPLDSDDLEQYYDTEIPFGGRIIQVDLNFENKSIDIKKLETAKHFIENIRIYDINNKRHIASDYNAANGDTVKFYLQHHLKELGTAELAALLPRGSKSVDHEKLLLQKLQLTRVGIYPDNAEKFAVFDYTIGIDVTNDVVVIFTDESGNMDYMTIES
jgi:hypothetical protein